MIRWVMVAVSLDIKVISSPIFSVLASVRREMTSAPLGYTLSIELVRTVCAVKPAKERGPCPLLPVSSTTPTISAARIP